MSSFDTPPTVEMLTAQPPLPAAAYRVLKSKLQRRLQSEPGLSRLSYAQVRAVLEDLMNTLLAESGVQMIDVQRQMLLESLIADVLGFGPLDRLLADDSISTIFVNNAAEIYVERDGVIQSSPVQFNDEAHLMHVLERILAPFSGQLSETDSFADVRMPDGSRVTVVQQPVAQGGTLMVIRKPPRQPYTATMLAELRVVSQGALDFLRACVGARLNVLVCGKSDSGKTTFINVLSSFIPTSERVVVVESISEFQLQHPHVVTLRAPTHPFTGALALHPDRLVFGNQPYDWERTLRVLAAGHDGALLELDAPDPRRALELLSYDVAHPALISSNVHLIVSLAHLRDGGRRVTHIAEVQRGEHGTPVVVDLFARPEGRSLKPTGARPACLPKLESAGIKLATGEWFEVK